MDMIDYEQLTSVIGCFCTLLFPYRGQTEGTIVEDYGTSVIVRLINGEERGLDFIPPFLAMAMLKQAWLCSFGLTKRFDKDEVIIYE